MPGFLGISRGPYSPDRVLEDELGGIIDGTIREGDAETTALLLHAAVSIRWREDPKTVLAGGLSVSVVNTGCL